MPKKYECPAAAHARRLRRLEQQGVALLQDELYLSRTRGGGVGRVGRLGLGGRGAHGGPWPSAYSWGHRGRTQGEVASRRASPAPLLLLYTRASCVGPRDLNPRPTLSHTGASELRSLAPQANCPAQPPCRPRRRGAKAKKPPNGSEPTALERIESAANAAGEAVAAAGTAALTTAATTAAAAAARVNSAASAAEAAVTAASTAVAGAVPRHTSKVAPA